MTQKTVRDLRNPLAKARDAFLDSPEGKAACNGAPSGIYLRNRIEVAFIAGWNAHALKVELND